MNENKNVPTEFDDNHTAMNIVMGANMTKKERVAYFGAKKFKDILRDITKIKNEADMNEVEKVIYASNYCETITCEQDDLLYGILNAMERYAYNRNH